MLLVLQMMLAQVYGNGTIENLTSGVAAVFGVPMAMA